MSNLSRRDFVFVSSGAAFGNMIIPGMAEADDHDDHGPDWSQSGLVTGQLKPLRHNEIPGFLSAEQIAPHHTAHYGGALKGYVSADRELEESIQSGKTLGGAAYGALKRARTTKGDSVVLHELYFDGMVPQAPDPSEDVRSAIAQRFGSLEKWADDFQNCAKAASGWAILAYHPVNGKLYNVISDAHDVGVLWMATPLVVIDTYEHAFYIDYHNRKGDYVEKFTDHIDWDAVNARYRAVASA